jgi:hypothetical protein
MKCKFIKPDGIRCNSYAMSNHDFCWRHSPDVSDEEKQESLKKGGKGFKNSRIVINLPDLKITNTHDLPPFLIDTIRCVRSGIIDTRVGSVIGYLTAILLRSYELSNLEERLERLEQTMSNAYIETDNPND